MPNPKSYQDIINGNYGLFNSGLWAGITVNKTDSDKLEFVEPDGFSSLYDEQKLISAMKNVENLNLKDSYDYSAQEVALEYLLDQIN